MINGKGARLVAGASWTHRRLAKDYENLADTLALAFVRLASIQLALRRPRVGRIFESGSESET